VGKVRTGSPGNCTCSYHDSSPSWN
jgi:hypothetical protein